MTVKDIAPTRHRSFSDDEAEGDENPLEPITFDLHNEKFTALPEIQGAALLDFVKGTQSGDSSVLLSFLEDAMEDDEWKRLDALLHSKTKITKVKKIRAIVEFLVEEYTSRNSSAS